MPFSFPALFPHNQKLILDNTPFSYRFQIHAGASLRSPYHEKYTGNKSHRKITEKFKSL